MTRAQRSLCVIGRGKVGLSLCRGLRESSAYQTHSQRGRPPYRNLPEADVYILAVPDQALRSACEALAPRLPTRAVVLHCAGARGPDELSAARHVGASVGVFHPLVSFADKRSTPLFSCMSFVGTGDDKAMREARHVARALKAHFVRADSLGPPYHAAAALVANGSVGLAFVGLKILHSIGIPEKNAGLALAGLLRSVADNLESVGLPGALTGPVRRGDADTVFAHLQALQTLSPALAEAYGAVQPMVLSCAEAAGLSRAEARKVARVILGHKARQSKK